jgi:hypothetical protein
MMLCSIILSHIHSYRGYSVRIRGVAFSSHFQYDLPNGLTQSSVQGTEGSVFLITSVPWSLKLTFPQSAQLQPLPPDWSVRGQ